MLLTVALLDAEGAGVLERGGDTEPVLVPVGIGVADEVEVGTDVKVVSAERLDVPLPIAVTDAVALHESVGLSVPLSVEVRLAAGVLVGVGTMLGVGGTYVYHMPDVTLGVALTPAEDHA